MLKELSQQQWSRIESVVEFSVLILVAVIAALMASHQKTRSQTLERQFQFRDERMKLYAEFIEKMNDTLEIVFSTYLIIDESDVPERDHVRKLDSASQILDSVVMRIQVSCPNFVVHSVMNLNGRIQTMSMNAGRGEELSIPTADFEAAKRNMLKAMRCDIDLIESVRDRRKYIKLLPRQGRKYQSETGFSLDT